jgi:glycosyltransferase involved in cell wall biosynthesis
MSERAEKDSAPQISVIMGVYNQYHRKQLMCAINSIREQSFKDFEFIIYDDGSAEEPAVFLQNAAKADKRIRIIREEKNMGLAFSLNRCIHEARGKYIARMDADDISTCDRLQIEYDFLETHPQYGWVGSNAFVFSKQDIWGKMVMAEYPNQYNFLPFSPYIHPSVMFRKEILDSNGTYKVSRSTLKCEDYELFMRLYQQGINGYNLQQVLLFYRQGLEAYKKRTMKNRIREARVRMMNFPKMGIPFSKCVIYTLRPVLSGLIPYSMIAWYKRKRYKECEENDQGTRDIQEVLCTYIDQLYSMGFEGSR